MKRLVDKLVEDDDMLDLDTGDFLSHYEALVGVLRMDSAPLPDHLIEGALRADTAARDETDLD